MSRTTSELVLVFTRKGDALMSVPIERSKTTIGSGSNCTVVLPDDEVPEHALEVHVERDLVVVREPSVFGGLESAAGASDIGAPIQIGDSIDVGPYRVELARQHRDSGERPPERATKTLRIGSPTPPAAVVRFRGNEVVLSAGSTLVVGSGDRCDLVSPIGETNEDGVCIEGVRRCCSYGFECQRPVS